MGQRLRKTLLYWRTARHLKASQVFWRLRYRLGNGRATRYRAPDPLPSMDERVAERVRDLALHWAVAVPPDALKVQAFLRGRFTFINKTVQSARPLWRGLDVSKLWAYHLNYFDYGREIALLHPDPASEEAATLRAWMDDWMAKNPRGTTPAWDAFPLSARLINWSMIAAVYGWRDFALVSSMHEQLEYLAGHLERDLLGNHLLKNAAALTVAGALLNSPRAEEGLALLEAQVRAQFLPDGGHIERSPMYHAFVLRDLLFACAVLEPRPSWLEDAVARGLTFLQGVTHEDGQVAQFNDGAASEGPDARSLYTLASYFDPDLAPAVAGSTAFAESGLYRLEPGGVGGLMLVKAGHSTVNYQPGHAHSDLLSFEYSLRGERLLVNTGTHGYAESPCRNYCRSCASHNTLRINGEEQLEHWSTFRVGRRIHAEVLAWDPYEPTLRAAYTTRRGTRHERLFAWDSGGWCRVQDKISGTGALSVETFLHFHPDCHVEVMDERPGSGVYRPFRLRTGAQILQLLIFGANNVTHHRGTVPLGPGWYFPRFGEAVAADTLVAHSVGNKQMTISFVIAPCDEQGIPPEIIQNFLSAWSLRNGGS
jgi:hypothetical protein